MSGRDGLTGAGGDYAYHLARTPSLPATAARRLTSLRLAVMASGFALLFAVFGARFGWLALAPAPDGPHIRPPIDIARAEILDRNGTVLATQIRGTHLVVRPDKIISPARTAAGLKAIFPALDEERLLDGLIAPARKYFVIQRNLSAREEAAVLRLGEPGLRTETSPQRIYPNGALTAHVTGFVSQDLTGLAGLEYTLDQSGDGERFLSSLDLRIQHIVRDVMLAGLDYYRAQAGVGILLDADNGQIIAMVSLPDFDPNKPQTAPPSARFNRATLGVYELGSVFKLFTAAMALENDAVSPHQTLDVSVPLRLGRTTIADAHPPRQADAQALTLDEVIALSSNIGAAQLALAVEPRAHWRFLKRMGFLERPRLELPEIARPIAPPQWGEVTRATVSFGHGIAISPLQAALGGAALVNGGILYEPQLRLGARRQGTRVLATSTSQHLRRMMRAVVQNGTAQLANLGEFDVLGKTGTAEKSAAGGYDKARVLTSFLSAFPGRAPRYVLFVMLDEPQGREETYGKNEAGWNVAPLSRDIIARAAPLLGLSAATDEGRADAPGQITQ